MDEDGGALAEPQAGAGAGTAVPTSRRGRRPGLPTPRGTAAGAADDVGGSEAGPPGPRPAARAAAVVLPAGVALGLGLWRLTVPGMWRDEAVSYAAAQRTVGQLWSLTAHVDAVHGLYYLLLHAVFAVAGPSPATLRLPSVLGGAAAAAMAAAVGVRWAGPRVGLLAGLYWACLPQVSRYLQEGRSYALVSFGVAATVWFLLRAAWLPYALALGLTAALNEMALLALPAFAAYAATAPRAPARGVAAAGTTMHGAARRWAAVSRAAARGTAGRGPDAGGHGGRAALVRWLVATVAGAAMAVPVAWRASGESAVLSWIRPPDRQTLLELGTGLAGSRWAVLPAAVLAGYGYLSARRTGGGPGRLASVALPLLVLPPAALLVWSWLAAPTYTLRYVLYVLLAMGWLVALGLDALSTRLSRILLRRDAGTAVALVVVAALAASGVPHQLQQRRPNGHGDHFAAIAALVAAGARPGDAVLFAPRGRQVIMDAYASAFRDTVDVALREPPARAGNLTGILYPPAEVRARLRAHPRVWVLLRHHRAEGPNPLPGQGFHLTRHWHFTDGQSLLLYTADAPSGARGTAREERTATRSATNPPLPSASP